MITGVAPCLAASLLGVSLVLLGCGEMGGDRAGTFSSADPSAEPAVPADSPKGAGSRQVSYTCANGRKGALGVDIPDLSQLADTLNAIQLCEYDEGVLDATLTVDCPQGRVVVRLRSVDGVLQQPVTCQTG